MAYETLEFALAGAARVAWLSSVVGGLSVAGVGLAVVLVLMLDGLIVDPAGRIFFHNINVLLPGAEGSQRR